MARPKKQGLGEMLSGPAAELPRQNTAALVARYKDEIERARAAGYTWSQVADGLTVDAGRRVTAAALVSAWGRMYGGTDSYRARLKKAKPKTRRPALGGAATRHEPAAAPRPTVTPTSPTRRAPAHRVGGQDWLSEEQSEVLDNGGVVDL